MRRLHALILHRAYEEDVKRIWGKFRMSEFRASELPSEIPYRNAKKIISRGYVIKVRTVSKSSRSYNVYRISDRIKGCCMERFDGEV